MDRDLYVVLNRFTHEFARYDRYLPEQTGRLAYVTTARSARALDAACGVATETTEDLAYDQATAAVERIVRSHGTPKDIVALSDYDILTAARLRDAFGVAGGQSTNLVMKFKDKPLMKDAVAAAGLRIPRYLALDQTTDAAKVIAAVGLPLVLKPRRGVASLGVRRIDTLSELQGALAAIEPAEYECEEFVSGRILHIDGIRRDTRTHFVSASAYLNSCLDFANGLPLGSIILDRGEHRTSVIAFADQCLNALGLADGAFHLEVIEEAHGGLCFLEVGLRPGGAQVAFVHRDLFGVELFAEAFRASTGLRPLSDPHGDVADASGGWLLMPEPAARPSRLVQRTSLIDSVPEIYHEALPEPGRIFRGDGSYDNPGGIFRLRGPDAKTVHQAMLTVIERYKLVTEPV
ncbi:ATP-grasp domain-containing protein [Kutzneria sp. CA-103260]|uniref:ATP-grasp domain-containing protein n=1 Tax=Kutzneria sp. CA-103260 TaxID=2802641 RepID=UPI001BA4D7C3|nr:hypothetical protein [Kutzneria sp. CA-103260]QUQ64475.1 ATP-grasp domain-containing protein [Kutzneria sp. CA-103260]